MKYCIQVVDNNIVRSTGLIANYNMSGTNYNITMHGFVYSH